MSRVAGLGPQCRDRRRPVHPGHHHIQQDGIRALGLRPCPAPRVPEWAVVTSQPPTISSALWATSRSSSSSSTTSTRRRRPHRSRAPQRLVWIARWPHGRAIAVVPSAPCRGCPVPKKRGLGDSADWLSRRPGGGAVRRAAARARCPLRLKLLISGTGLIGRRAGDGGQLRLPIPPNAPAGAGAPGLCFGVAALLAACPTCCCWSSALTSPTRAAPRATSSLLLCLLVGIAGIVIFPLARRRGTDLTRMVLDGIVHRRVGAVHRQRDRVPADPRAQCGEAAPSACSCRSPMWSSRPWRPADAPRRAAGSAGARRWRPPASPATRSPTSAYAVLVSQTGTFTFGSIVDLGWIAGYTLIALAVRSPGSAASPHGERPVEPRRCWAPRSCSPCSWSAAVLSLVSLNRGTLTHRRPPLLWFVVLLGVLARQIMLVVDNERLRQDPGAAGDRAQPVLASGRPSRATCWSTRSVTASTGSTRPDWSPSSIPPPRACSATAPHELIGRGRPPDVPRRRARRRRTTRPTSATSPRRSATRSSPTPRRTATCAPTAADPGGGDGDSPLIVDGEAIGAVVVFRDVTQRHEVDRLKSEFVSMVSHELRTPLTAIRGSLGLIAGGALGSS